MKKGLEILPDDNYRIRDEDRYNASDISFGSKGSNASTASSSNLGPLESYKNGEFDEN
jgi:hypothetical protein